MNRRNVIIAFLITAFSILFAKRAATFPSKGQNEFALKFFAQTFATEPLANIVISPLSVYLALSLLYKGANGITKKEIRALLDSHNLDLEAFNQSNLVLVNTLNNQSKQANISIANSLWIKKGVSIHQKYIDTLKYFYQAEIANLDFNNPDSLKKINQWVQEKTKSKISKIVDRIDRDQVLFLINAIYFKGNWATPFNEQLTQKRPFFQLDGSTKQVDLMSIYGSYAYLENEIFQVVSLPYTDINFSLDVYLPKKGIKLKKLLDTFNLENWQTWTNQLKRNEGTLEIPRFKLDFTITLNKILEKLGIGSAFNPKQANFSALTDMSVYVSEVLHKTYLAVNEQGTEAAAVTSIGMRATAIMPSGKPFIFRADRPFLCVLRENDSLLFMATVVSPT